MMVKYSMPAFEKVYTTKETAVRLKVSESFLNKKRVSGGGPKFIKVGRAVRYPESAIDEYMAGQLRTSTSDSGPACNRSGNEPRNIGADDQNYVQLRQR
jgi:excisionase family DNA binding protein